MSWGLWLMLGAAIGVALGAAAVYWLILWGFLKFWRL